MEKPEKGDLSVILKHNQAEEKPKEESNQEAPPPIPPSQQECPRCASTNTKFCYFNNYSFSQPRHYCKDCKRYWTQGGNLRNIPVGGSARKERRLKKGTSAPNHHSIQERKPHHRFNLATRTTVSMPTAPTRHKDTSTVTTPCFVPIAPASPMYFPHAGSLSPFQAIHLSNQTTTGSGHDLSLSRGYSAPLLQHPPQTFYMGSQEGMIPLEKRQIQPVINMPTPPHQDWRQNFVCDTSVMDNKIYLSTTGSNSRNNKSSYSSSLSLKNPPSFPDPSGFDPPF